MSLSLRAAARALWPTTAARFCAPAKLHCNGMQAHANRSAAEPSPAAAGPTAGGAALPQHAPAAATTQQQQQQQQQQEQQKVRSYPDEPRVGVGVVILRQLPPENQPEVLLIRRAKEPAKGLWCFPGGSLELGETLVECAVRETMEETGLRLRSTPIPEGELFSDTLDFPSPIAAADSLTQDGSGRLLYHYAIINMAAVPEDPHQQPVPADDVDGAQWFPVAHLRGLKDLVVHCDRVAERAVRHFTITH